MAYKAAVGQKWVTPSEFWAMPPGEFWWLVDANTPESFAVENRQELIDLLNEARANG